ncbi:MAG: HD domain-containing protein [Rhodospirillaceae bacterium]|nr:HD domain-containing protein [Rhodospirillaceae bacterium]
MSNSALWAEIERAFARRGDQSYGEGVSQRAHALQCAALAEQRGAPPAEIVAALLHDIGHLIHDLPETIADDGIDTEHESLGAAWLSQWFGPDVSEPVLLHVAAKRYLCATEAGYFDELSAASVLSLRLQGGPMNEVAAVEFAARAGAAAAIRLRQLDDEGKDPAIATPPLEHFRPLVEALARR